MTREEFQAHLRERLIAHAVEKGGIESATLDIGAEVALFLHEDYAVAWRVLDKFMVDTQSSGEYLLTLARLYPNLDERRKFITKVKTQFLVMGMDDVNARLQAFSMMNQLEAMSGTFEGFEIKAVNLDTGEEVIPPREKMN
jgi:hypothetical protein